MCKRNPVTLHPSELGVGVGVGVVAGVGVGVRTGRDRGRGRSGVMAPQQCISLTLVTTRNGVDVGWGVGHTTKLCLTVT